MTVWNDAAFTQRLAHANWMANVAVLAHLNRRATGDPAREWMGSWARQWFVRDDTRVLVLGCGEGWLERSIAHWPFITHIDAVDFAAEAVQRARQVAPEKVAYGVVDLNRDELPEGAYDIVIAHSVLHHVENLEHAYAQIERTLRADGTLIVNEYAGPNRFQFSDRVLEIMNALLRTLGYAERRRPGVEEMIANDPTEAVRAAELVEFTRRHFDVVDRRDIGGTILQHLLYEIALDFRWEVPRERAIVELLCEIEAMFVDAGDIPCDFVLLAARKRGAPPPRGHRHLVPGSEEGRDLDEDPLTMARPARGVEKGAGLSKAHLRMLRIALASTQQARRNLFREAGWRSALERFRARGRDPWRWIEARAAHADPVVMALMRTAATLRPGA